MEISHILIDIAASSRMVPLRTFASVEIAKFKVSFRDSNPPASTFPFPRVGIPFFRRFRPRFSAVVPDEAEWRVSSYVVSSWLSFIFSCDRAILRRATIRPAHLLLLVQSTFPPLTVLVFVRVSRFALVILFQFNLVRDYSYFRSTVTEVLESRKDKPDRKCHY